MILVAGATGLIGGEICRRLAARGEPVRALVRPTSDPAQVGALLAAGVETVVGDLRDRPSLAAACRDISAVVDTVSTIPSSFEPDVNDIRTTDIAGAEQLVEAAATTGVTHFVYVSLSGGLDLEFPLRSAKRRLEARVRESGMAYTIVRPGCLMETWLVPAGGLDAAGATAVVCGDGRRPISWVCAGDVAEVGVRCLRNPAARDATVELGGPEALTTLEVIRIFEETVGRPFAVTFVPAGELAARQAAATDDLGRSEAGFMRCIARGDAIPMEGTTRTFGVELTPVRAFAAAALGRSVSAAG
jgi:uncharacterized protein YbjT (DUF2867 family)